MFCSSVCFYIFNMILYLLFYFDFSLLLGFWRTLRLVFFYLERFSTVHFIIHFPFPNFILILSEMILLENFARFQMNAKNQRSSVILQYLMALASLDFGGRSYFHFLSWMTQYSLSAWTADVYVTLNYIITVFGFI